MAVQIVVGFSLFDWIVARLPEWITRWLPQILLDRLRPIADQWQTKAEDFVSTKLSPLWDKLAPVIHVFTNLKDSTIGLWTRAEKLTRDIIHEYTEIKNFREDLHWRGRVVNAPQVVKKIKRLTEIPLEVTNKVKDLFQRIKDQFPEGGKSPAQLADEAAAELEGIDGFRGLLADFAPRLAKGAERSLGVLAILVECLVAWNAAIDDLQTIVDDIREVRLDFEKLDLIFLPQENRRRFETFADGRKIRLRIGGHLHPV